MLRVPLLASLALVAAGAATLSYAQENLPESATDAGSLMPLADVEWNYSARARDDEGEPYIRFSRDGNMSMGSSDMPEVTAALAGVSTAQAGQEVGFSLTREAGVLACTGRVTAPGRAAGVCRFDPDRQFVRELALRDLQPEDSEELLGLAFVDARVASIDDMSRAGFRIADVDELAAVSALEVTAAYASELREAGLEPEDVDELVSAKAVGVEPIWVTEMAEAGYADLGMEKAIELRALGITPDYARRMTRVMRAVEGIE